MFECVFYVLSALKMTEKMEVINQKRIVYDEYAHDGCHPVSGKHTWPFLSSNSTPFLCHFLAWKWFCWHLYCPALEKMICLLSSPVGRWDIPPSPDASPLQSEAPVTSCQPHMTNYCCNGILTSNVRDNHLPVKATFIPPPLPFPAYFGSMATLTYWQACPCVALQGDVESLLPYFIQSTQLLCREPRNISSLTLFFVVQSKTEHLIYWHCLFYIFSLHANTSLSWAILRTTAALKCGFTVGMISVSRCFERRHLILYKLGYKHF